MNTIVSFEVAELLKEKGFNESTIKCYDRCEMLSSYVNNVFKPKNYNTSGYIVSAPTIAEVVMWLYEKHGIWIEVIETDLFDKFFFQIKRKDNTRLKNGDYNSPTEAYESAIKYVLTNLI